MTDDWSVRPGVLCVQPHGAIFENNQVKGLVKPPVKAKKNVSLFGTEQKLDPYASFAPPVVALSVQQRLGVTVQRRNGFVGIVALLRVIQGYEESRLLNGIQRLLVLTAAEVGVTSVGPRGPAGYQTTSVNSGRNYFSLV